MASLAVRSITVAEILKTTNARSSDRRLVPSEIHTSCIFGVKRGTTRDDLFKDEHLATRKLRAKAERLSQDKPPVVPPERPTPKARMD
ncbi:hypothetical protein CCHR01_15032 [Colletotrichum chrysophilum]|uniref:Uncharacterized protein n=1 Tax=Colletotrichum chrysophilum TaxID=1836956 RepID=A0AAD9EEZ6_9PEZI|nr:hypothetical protein CCHR01_15032 [Colletotrichum chrysophilum]